MPKIAQRAVASRSLGGNQIEWTRGSGALIWTSESGPYLDFVCGYGPVVLGHADPDFIAGVDSILSRGSHFPGYSSTHREYVDELFDGKWPSGGVGFFKSSSEAIHGAMRLAAMRTGKKGVLRCGYIGWHDAQLAGGLRWHEPVGSALRSVVHDGNWFRGVHGSERVFNWCSLRDGELENIVAQHGDSIGVAVMDTYQADLGGLQCLDTFVKECRRHGIVSVLDETKTAGRVSNLGRWPAMAEEPDMVVLGKAIANGAPLSLLVVKDYDEREFVLARIGGTHSKEQYGVAAALVTLRLMRERDGLRRLRTAGRTVARALRDAATSVADLGFTCRSRLEGAAFDVDIVTPGCDVGSQREAMESTFFRAGVVLLTGHPSFVCLAHTNVSSEYLYDRARTALTEIRRCAYAGPR